MRFVCQRIIVASLMCSTMFLEAASVIETYAYKSTATLDANGPLDLVAELNYDNSRSNAPLAVVMHGYSGSTGKLGEVRGNAQYLRDKGFFAVSVAMRGRDGSDGVRDSGGLEIYDIYDAVEAVKADYPGLVNPDIVYLTGYSGGGGNTLAALCKFPDFFNAGAAFFGMSDYGHHRTNGWYFNGASSSHCTQMRTDIGDPTSGVASVTDRYHARASNLASANNPYSEIHLFVNNNETTCPPVNMTTFYSNAVSQEAFAGEFSNITVHIGQSGLYQDFNTNGLDEATELQYWPHGAPTSNQQAAAETWFMARLLAGQIPRRALNASDSLYVAGFVKTTRFECRVGDGQQGAVRLDYTLSSTNMTFRVAVLSLNTQQTSRLSVDTGAFSGQTVEVFTNGVRARAFVGGGTWMTEKLWDGDTLELRALGPATLGWQNVGVSNVGTTSAWATAFLAGTNADVWCFCGTNNPGWGSQDWDQSVFVGHGVPTGRVEVVLTGLLSGTSYVVSFLATNIWTGEAQWSDVTTFTTLRPREKLLAYYDFEQELHDQGTNGLHGVLVTSGGVGVTFTNLVPSALVARSHEAAAFDGLSWISLPFLNLYGRTRAGGVSVSFWTKGGSSVSSWLLAEGCTTSTAPSYCFGPKQGVATLRAFVRTDSNSGRLDRQSAGAVFDGAWHHVVWTDLAGTARLYLDGAVTDTVSFAYTTGTLTMDTTTIGALVRKPADLKYPFVGLIDDLAVWDEVLSTNSIAALSAGVSPLELAGLLSDPLQPVQITGLNFSGTTNLSLVFSGPTLAVQPRPWYTTNLLSADWSPVPALTLSTKANGVFTQSFNVPPSGAATFYKIAY